jgi:SPP1 gp7 family putative phage head morphogenesis protein
MAITDSLREDIRAAVAQAIEDGDSAAELSDRLEELSGFSAERADMIARTEIVRAHNAGSMTAMRESGVVQRKAWSTSEDDDVSEECEANADAGDIGIDEDFPSGDDAPPAHPNCRCVAVAVIAAAESEDEEEDDTYEAAE